MREGPSAILAQTRPGSVRFKKFPSLLISVRVSLVQFAPAFQKTAPNWERMREWAKSLPADVIVFPELATCGYMYKDRDEVAPFVEGLEALEPIAKISKASGRLIAGGRAELDDGAISDCGLAAGPDGPAASR